MLIIAAMVGFTVFSFLNREPAATQQQSSGDTVQRIQDSKSPFEQERLAKDEISRIRERQLKTQEEAKRKREANQADMRERRERHRAAYGQ